jgi:FtsP/CotA-like multicopper oxidase with cupredoxin domain
MSRFWAVVSVTCIFALSFGLSLAQTSKAVEPRNPGQPGSSAIEPGTEGRTLSRIRTMTPAQRKAAAQRLKRRIAEAQADPETAARLAATPPPSVGIAPVPNYFGTVGNYANSPLPAGAKIGLFTSAGPGIRKFVNTLPGLGPANKNNLNQYIPIATPIAASNLNGTPRFPNQDYYEIGLVDYTQQMHSDLPATTRLRGYRDLNPTPNPLYAGDTNAHYLGPLIIAQRDKPVRIKFTNMLAPGAAGDLFLPVDTTLMGAGLGPLGLAAGNYTQNRANLHLHGGNTPWISDGTPHQWITPAGDPTPYKKGVSFQNVPDMVGAGNIVPNPIAGDGIGTYYYPNQQSGRLMFYHDHSYGITRLNVYAGEAAGYLLWDPVELNLITTGKLPNLGGVYQFGVPLIIQDKSFVPPPAQLAAQDPTWMPSWGPFGNLWFPHVYMPNQNPADDSGANATGRWDYGPWFWPPLTVLAHGPIAGGTPDCPANPLYPTNYSCPGTPNPSHVPEAFMDTMVVNGTPYPTFTVDKRAYRFRILNASNDRHLNLQLYYADPLAVSVTNGGSGYPGSPAPAPAVSIIGCSAATGTASVVNGVVIDITVAYPPLTGPGCTGTPTVTIAPPPAGTPATAIASTNTEVKMVPAVPHVVNPIVDGPDADDPIPACAPGVTVGVVSVAYPRGCWPETWPTDGRDGGVPDPTTAGPPLVQIGNEGGLLPAPAVHWNTPVGYNYNRRDIVVLNVEAKGVFVGPAERVDVVVDFSQVPAGSRLILYNDSPAPVPANDPRQDYYTNNPDQTDTGGAPSTWAGYGPNTRTIMQLVVSANVGPAFDLAALQTALKATGAGGGGAYAASQPAPLVPQAAYGLPTAAAPDASSAFNQTFPNAYGRIQNNVLTYTPVGGGVPITAPLLPKAIHELFETDYGRMNSVLGVELPLTSFLTQTTIPLKYVDPPTEIIKDGETQIWKITHNGVDTHAVHFHLFNVQVLNRVGWDGAIRPPDADELGWKETLRMNPLEDIFVALQPYRQTLPWPIPDSVRLLDPSSPQGTSAQFTGVNPATNAGNNVSNQPTNFGWEYVWHCHLLGHEENDMMRPIMFRPAPNAPVLAGVATGPTSAALTWQETSSTLVSFTPASVTDFILQRSTTLGFTAGTVVTANLPATPFSFPDTPLVTGTQYWYRLAAVNNGVAPATQSAWSNVVTITPAGPPVPAVPLAPSGLTAVQPPSSPTRVILSWTDNSNNETSFTVQRAPVGPGNVIGTWVTLSTTVPAHAGTGLMSPGYINTPIVRGTTYAYQVQAVNAIGPSAWSAPVIIVTTL